MTGVKSEVIVPGPLRRHIVPDVPLSLMMGKCSLSSRSGADQTDWASTRLH